MKENRWPYQYAIAEIDSCFVDLRYQRPSIPSFVSSIAASYRAELIGALMASQREDGRFALLDGHQRWMALKELGVSDVPLLVYNGLSYEQEAEFFAVFNFDRKNMQPWYLYRALRESNNVDVLAVDAIVQRYDLIVGHSVNNEAMLGCPGTLTAIFHNDADVVRSSAMNGDEVLARTLEAITTAWRGWALTWKSAKTGGMIRGVARWVSVNPSVPALALAAALRVVEPAALHQSAKEMQAGGSGSGKGRKMEAAIETLYVKHGDKRHRTAA